ncbi:MAG: hypothetical protein A3G24_21770 [Betaproteobacteria bacterium RIFCSPLOWO2_12_FULL_62_13]|nr:MAG: hypothetical protein A3G24_21770 [Betaproteobacteria bacterium RIFCSPLOWO2_12_FULL_62_13]
MNATKKQAGMGGGLPGSIRRLTWAVTGMLFLIAAGLPQAWAASPVTVTLTAPPNGSTYAAPATITLTATATATQGYKVSKVEFFHGTTLIGTDTKSPYSVTWNNVQPGNYALTAKATAVKKKSPNQIATSSPVSITVNAPNAPPTVSLTSPPNGASFNAPASVTLAATASDTDGSIQKVEFFHGGTNLIATVSAPPYTFDWQNVQAGGYTLTAVATDNLGGATISSPVSITVNAVAALYFIHTDHLNTPRLITNGAGQTAWRWDNTDPFGGNPPDENPSGLGNFTCNLRLPGQYFDRETNLHYNYFRDYDPSIGRYIQSDPIGLDGGINTYAYVANDPMRQVDPMGLFLSPVHGSMTLEAAQGTGLSTGMAWQVAKDNMNFDFVSGSQSSELANNHAMTRPGQDPNQAREYWKSFIEYQIRQCTAKGLGWALHAVQDSYAGGHNFKSYGGPGSLLINDPMHLVNDAFPSAQRRAGAVEASRQLIKRWVVKCTNSCTR